MHKATFAMLPAVALLAASTAWSDEVADDGRNLQQAVRDAWIDGRLEAAYLFNEHLNPFAIHTDVESGVVTLTGTVESDIDRDLAGEIAEGLEGVVQVDNRLQVGGEPEVRAADADAEERRSFGQWVNDASTSAAVKVALIDNDNVRARAIRVQTRDDVVTLTGIVRSDEERDLAEQLARNTRDVAEVRNELEVDSTG